MSTAPTNILSTMSKLPKGSSSPRLNPRWCERLTNALADVLDFREYPNRDGIVLRAESSNARAVLQMFRRGDVLELGTLRIALPIGDELELLKLSCWTMIWVKSLFPAWRDSESWVQMAISRAVEADTPVVHQLYGYRISCRYDRMAKAVDYEVTRSSARAGRKPGE